MNKKIIFSALFIGLGIILMETANGAETEFKPKKFAEPTMVSTRPAAAQKVIINPPRVSAERLAKAKIWAKEKIGIVKELKDPFQVDFLLSKKGEGPAETSESLEKKSFVLQGVIVGSTRSAALIDDNVYGLGEYYNGWKLVGVKKDRVGLKKGKEVKKLHINLGGVSNGK